MANNNDVVIIELDRPRVLRFGHKALKHLSALTGVSIDDLSNDDMDLDQVEKIIYCGLLSDAQENGETLKLEDMENLLDKAPSPQHYMIKMTEAFSAAFGAGANEGNGKATGKPKK